MTQEELKKVLRYNKDTGKFTLLNGRPVGWLDDKGTRGGYIRIALLGKQYLGHRLAWLYEYGIMPDHIDHKNRVRHDNRLENLKVSSAIENAKNRKTAITNTSGYSGVSKKPNGKWIARIVDDTGNRISLGTFVLKEQAIEARKKAEQLYGYTSH